MGPPYCTHAELVDQAASRIDTGGCASDARKTVHVTTRDASCHVVHAKRFGRAAYGWYIVNADALLRASLPTCRVVQRSDLDHQLKIVAQLQDPCDFEARASPDSPYVVRATRAFVIAVCVLLVALHH